MKNKIIALFLLSTFYCLGQDVSNYKVVYKIDYVRRVNPLSTRTEFAFLMIEGNKQSFYTSENTYKKDSIDLLVDAGILNPHEVMNDKFPKTSFKHFVEKNYTNQDMKVSTLLFNNYVYTQKNALVWQLQADTLRIKNYFCHKAKTNYEGRDYVAWYTTEIPISDGPYKFWGLPGLIVKIADTENHYVFSLESFGKQEKQLHKIPFKTKKTFEVSYTKFKALEKESIENPNKFLEDQAGIKVTSDNGKDPASIPVQKLNSIEKY